MWGIPNSGCLQKIGQNERLGVPSMKWLSLTHEHFPHHTRPTFTCSSLLRGLAPHTARNKRSAVACHFLPAILALFGENFTRKCTDFWGYRVDWDVVVSHYKQKHFCNSKPQHVLYMCNTNAHLHSWLIRK